MIESLHFVFDDIRSSEKGVLQVTTESGLFREQFLAPKRINEEKVRGNDKPYFLGVERDPLTFPLTLLFEDGFDEDEIRDVARWLDQNTYKPFYTELNPNRIFYCMTVDSSEHIHNGIKNGYLTLNFRCDSPFTYSPVYTEIIDLSENDANGFEYNFPNNGDLECKPYMTIEMLENGDLTVVNNSQGGKEFKFTGLSSGEVIKVDNEYEDIESSIVYTYRYDNFNDNYLSFDRGINRLKIYGKCKIEFKFQFKTLQG